MLAYVCLPVDRYVAIQPKPTIALFLLFLNIICEDIMYFCPVLNFILLLKNKELLLIYSTPRGFHFGKIVLSY